MTEQQHHLQQLLEQRSQIDIQLTKNREHFWKVQGAIEYLTQIGVTLPEPPQEILEDNGAVELNASSDIVEKTED